MGLRPAAAAGFAHPLGAGSLDTRLRRLFNSRGRVDRSRLAERLLPASSSLSTPGSSESGVAELGFYWLQIAEWLADAFDLRSTERGRELFGDLCWAQYCVYGIFRVQDDLVDGESTDALVAVEANRLSTEAARCAARWFDGGSLFWAIYQRTIDQTSRAIVALHDLQRAAEREPHAELDLYVDLGACLKIAAAGVAIASGREDDWRRRVSPALDRLAVAGQVLDDLEDVEDDLADGRINYAAWWLCRPVFGATREALQAVVAFNLATGDRVPGLVEVARRHVVEAAEILGPSICPAVSRYLEVYRRRIDRVEASIERGRLELFG